MRERVIDEHERRHRFDDDDGAWQQSNDASAQLLGRL